MVGVYSKALGWWNSVDVVHVLLAEVTERRESVHCGWLLGLHGAATIGIAYLWGQLVLAVRRKFGHLG